MSERIIVTLTTWSKRIGNIPVVLDTIYAQTMKPDLVVLNLAYDEVIPEDVQNYIEQHSVEVNRVEDTKVYKKLIPTLKKYPKDCVIAIDDDWLYPEGMIEDFMSVHKLHPNNPISGNKEVAYGIQCHCGCASLTKAEYFGPYLDMIDDDVIANCPSDDMVYSYLSTLEGNPYYRTKKTYFMNMEPFEAIDGYTEDGVIDLIGKSYNYLVRRFGKIENLFSMYLSNEPIASFLDDLHAKSMRHSAYQRQLETEARIYSTYSFRIGQAIVKPFRRLKQLFLKNGNNDVLK